DEDEGVGRLDEEAAHGERNAVPLVGGDPALPERLGDDAEHGAAVEALEPGLEGVDAESAEFAGAPEWQGVYAHMLSMDVGSAVRRRRLSRRLVRNSWSPSQSTISRSSARSIRRRRTSTVARASPMARWRASFSMPKYSLSEPSERLETSGTRRRAIRT